MNKVREASKLILKAPEGVLLLVSNNGTLNLPGGGIDKGERPKDALQREVAEELGIAISLMSLKFIGRQWGNVTPALKSNQIGSTTLEADWRIFYLKADKVPKISLGEDVADILFTPPDQLPKDLRPMARNAIDLAMPTILQPEQ